MKTKVIFKKISFFNDSIAEINAIFPEHYSTDREGSVVYEGYAHMGQHCEFHEDFLTDGFDGIHKIETATEEEYKELFNELTNKVGYKLEVL